MKKIFNIFAIAALAAGTFALGSCSEDTPAEKDAGKTPVIKYARVCNPEYSDSLIVQASLGSKIAFVGDNLGDVRKIWFNDVQASLNPNYVTSNVIIVDIPNVIASEVTDIVKFVTSSGIETEYPFHVVVPGPQILTADCEWAKEGDNMVLTGAYFVDDPNVPLTCTFPGGLEAKIVSFTANELTVTVPEGAVEGPIKVETIYGANESSFYYKDTRNMMFDFEGIDGVSGLEFSGWHAPTIESGELSLSGKYLFLGGASLGNDSWDDGHFSFEFWPGDWNTPTSYPYAARKISSFIDFSDYQNMSVKFELMIPAAHSWQACGMQLMFSSVSQVSMGNAGVDIDGKPVAGANNSFFQSNDFPRAIFSPWTATEAYNTGDRWITVEIPMSAFAYGPDNTAAGAPLTEDMFDGFTIFVYGGGKEGVDCDPYFYIDNIRVFKNK